MKTYWEFYRSAPSEWIELVDNKAVRYVSIGEYDKQWYCGLLYWTPKVQKTAIAHYFQVSLTTAQFDAMWALANDEHYS